MSDKDIPANKTIVGDLGVPKIRTYTDCTGRQIVFSHGVHILDGKGVSITATETNGNPGYEFTSEVCATPHIAYLDLHKKIQIGLKQKHLLFTDNHLDLLANEMTGRVGYGGIVVDGKLVTFEQFADLLQTYEGWHISVKLG